MATANSDLVLARSLVLSAELAPTLLARWQSCLLAARHGSHALLTARRGPRPISGATELWGWLAAEVPAMAEWAAYFALIEARPQLSERQVDDLSRDLDLFLALVDQQLARRQEARVGHG